MPRNGLSASRSESPVTMCVAPPLTASSRNLSSLGSRQALIRTSASTHCASCARAARKMRMSVSSRYRRSRFLLKTSHRSARAANESRTFPLWSTRSRAWRGFEAGKSNALIKAFVSKTQRNYAPLRMESNISGVSPRNWAFRPTSSRTCCSGGYSPAASSRSQRLRRAWIFRFSSGAAELYIFAVCRSSGIVIVGFAMGPNLRSFYGKSALLATASPSENVTP